MWIPKVFYVNPLINEDDSYCLFIEDELVDIPKEVFEKMFYKLNDEEEEYVEFLMKMQKEQEKEIQNVDLFVERIKENPYFEVYKETMKKIGITKEQFIKDTQEKINLLGMHNLPSFSEEKISYIYDKIME